MLNSRPIGVTLIDEDLQPLTPNHLLIGRAQSGQVSQEVLTKGDNKYTKCTCYVSQSSPTSSGRPGSHTASLHYSPSEAG